MSPYVIGLLNGLRVLLLACASISVIAALLILLMFLVGGFRRMSKETESVFKKVFVTALIVFFLTALLAILIPNNKNKVEIEETTELVDNGSDTIKGTEC